MRCEGGEEATGGHLFAPVHGRACVACRHTGAQTLPAFCPRSRRTDRPPDLAGQFADGETLLAIAGKDAGGLTKGLTQALQYKEGFHLSFIAASTAAIGLSVERFARREGLGLMGVSDDVRVLHYPLPRQPWKAQWQSIRSQLDVAGEVMGHNTFHYNLPTHYLIC